MHEMSTRWGPIVVTILVIVMFGLAMSMIAFRLVPDASSIHDILIALLAQVQAVVSFWLGSSSGSKAKDSIIANQAGMPST